MTPNRAHRIARERAMREGREIYVITDVHAIRILPLAELPSNAKPWAGYRPSGEPIWEGELPS